MRQPRLVIAGQYYHLISRIIDGRRVIADEYDRATYLSLLGNALQRSDWDCLAYVVMSNHIHLLVRAGLAMLEQWTKATHSAFARRLNQRYGGIGHLFAERPSLWHVREHQVPRVLAYIHNNPVRAGVVTEARASSWTSHRAYTNGDGPAWLQCDLGFAACGLSGQDRGRQLTDWVDAELRTPRPDFDDAMGQAIRRAARARGALEVGTPTLAPRPEFPLLAAPNSRRYLAPPELLQWIAQKLQVSVELLCSRSRVRSVVRARQIAIKIGRELGISPATMAAAIGVSRQAAARLCSAVTQDERRLAAWLVEARRAFGSAWFTVAQAGTS